MPIYEYKCPNCGNQIELIQNYDDPNPHCEICFKKSFVWSNRTEEQKAILIQDRLRQKGIELTNFENDLMTEKYCAPSIPHKIKMKRLISQTSFSLKGGGWYKDGYAKGIK